MDEGKLLLPRKTSLEAVLRADTIHDCLDGDEDFGDHFVASLSTSVRHPLGEEIFSEKYFVLMPANQKSPFRSCGQSLRMGICGRGVLRAR
jgi:hypothetical protein